MRSGKNRPENGSDEKMIRGSFEKAREHYLRVGVDADSALERMSKIPLSLHCWQGDDVAGFEFPAADLLGGGIQVTGNYPGRARNIIELRQDIEKAFSLIPGRHRLNLHAIYGEFGNDSVARDRIEPDHFSGWVKWAKQRNIKLDFNATCFSHPKAVSGYTLSHRDEKIRDFWIEHVRRCRIIAAFMGRELGSPCIHNLWIPDGSKNRTVDRAGYRDLLRDSLDRIFAEHFPPGEMKDSLESKLFGIGSESFVVGSHEFYMGYALSRNKMICLDTGHFHPTESVADKISSLLPFSGELLLHVSRGIRWDSDHVVILNDELRELCQEIVRSRRISNIYLALDFFDASLNRVGAWAVGARALMKGLLLALLEPSELLRRAEEEGDHFSRMALLEQVLTLPFGAVWDFFCYRNGVPTEDSLRLSVLEYDRDVTRKRH